MTSLSLNLGKGQLDFLIYPVWNGAKKISIFRQIYQHASHGMARLIFLCKMATFSTSSNETDKMKWKNCDHSLGPSKLINSSSFSKLLKLKKVKMCLNWIAGWKLSLADDKLPYNVKKLKDKVTYKQSQLIHFLLTVRVSQTLRLIKNTCPRSCPYLLIRIGALIGPIVKRSRPFLAVN